METLFSSISSTQWGPKISKSRICLFFLTKNLSQHARAKVFFKFWLWISIGMCEIPVHPNFKKISALCIHGCTHPPTLQNWGNPMTGLNNLSQQVYYYAILEWKIYHNKFITMGGFICTSPSWLSVTSSDVISLNLR